MGLYGPLEGSHPTSAGGQGRSPKLKLYVTLSSLTVDNVSGAKEVIKLKNDVAIWLHPSRT